MTTKPKTTTTKPRKKQDAAPAQKARNATGAEMLGRSRVMGVLAIKAAAWCKFGDIDDLELHKELSPSLDAIKRGDLAPVETMLYLQAKALETLFTGLLHRGMAQESMPQYQAHMGLALKAQAQCRATLQALVEAKQPRSATFVRQANIAQQQQVNNVVPHARETLPLENELLEDTTHEQQQRMVPGAQAAPARGNQAVEAVGEIHRAED
jgi:hypothetical protein